MIAPFSLSHLLQTTGPGLVMPEALHFTAGARLFRGCDNQGAVFLADLSPFPPRNSIHVPALGNHYFLSADARHFLQLRDVDRRDGVILTDTPGFVPVLIAWSDINATLSYDLPDDRNRQAHASVRTINLPLERILPGAVFQHGVFHCFYQK